jgi:hypothetical protein
MIDEAIAEGDSDKVLELRKQRLRLTQCGAMGKPAQRGGQKNRITMAIYIDVMSRIFRCDEGVTMQTFILKHWTFRRTTFMKPQKCCK